MSPSKSTPRVLVIGGMNMDVLGSTKMAFHERDSLPGHVSFRPGGVGRNIAEQLVRLGAQVSLITAIGHDASASALIASCEELGIDLSSAIKVPYPSPVYLAIHDNSGDMLAAINDMRAMDALLPEHLKEPLLTLSYDACVLDANLSEPCLEAVAKYSKAPILADPVSAVKGMKLLPILPRLSAIKPNHMEALAITGESTHEEASKALIRLGVSQVFISLGAKGLWYQDQENQGLLPVMDVPEVPLTGAGDALSAGLAMGIAKRGSIDAIALHGLLSAERFLINRQQEEMRSEAE